MADERTRQGHSKASRSAGIDAQIGDDVALRSPISLYTRAEGSVTSREIATTGDATKRCAKAGILDVGGYARTGTDGQVTIVLTEFFCLKRSEEVQFTYPINLVATPRSREPVYLTSVQSVKLLPESDVVTITIFSWSPNGSPAANISVNWRCFLPAEMATSVD